MRIIFFNLLMCGIASAVVSTKRLVIVTGGNSGIGKECCRRLASLEGCQVMMGCRNTTAGQEVAAAIIQENPNACVECHPLDLASFSSVKSFAKSSIGNQPVSAVIHNAGVMAPPYEITVDGHELTFQVNHLSPFLLTDLLLPNLRKAHEDSGDISRVVLVSSDTHRWASAQAQGAAGGLASGADAVSLGTAVAGKSWGIGKWKAYAGSKLCNVLYAAELTKRFGSAGSGVVGIAVRPGTVGTSIVRHSLLMRLLFAVAHPLLTSVEEAGEAVVHAATDPDIVPGGYYDKKTPKPASAAAQDESLQKALWEVTQNVLFSRRRV